MRFGPFSRRSDDDADGRADGRATGDEKPGAAAKALSKILEQGTRVQAPAVRAYVARLRRGEPDATPADIVAKLEKRYLTAVVASGAAVGTTAAVPGIGTLVAFGAMAGETVAFLEATALFTLAVAQVHGIDERDRERRQALVLAVLVGDDGRNAVRDLIGPGRTKGGAWIGETTASLPLPAISQLNGRLLRFFVKRYAIKRGALAFGKALPMGLGAVVGGGGNRLMGKKIVANAQRAFGPAPTRWPATLGALPATGDDPDAGTGADTAGAIAPAADPTS